MESATDILNNGSSSSNTSAPIPIVSPSHLVKGKLVNVISRTWPGINKPGGVGKITKIYTEESSQLIKCVDVKYIVHGGTDKFIPSEFIEPHDYDGDRRRHTSERCTRCKSFRSDCLSCDLRFESEEAERLQREKDERERERQRLEELEKERVEKEDEMDSEDEEAYMAEIATRYRKMCRHAKKRSKQNKRTKSEGNQQSRRNKNIDESEGSDSDEENETLALVAKEKKKKMQREKIKRRKQSRSTSVLASLPLSSTEQIAPVSSKSSNGKTMSVCSKGQHSKTSVVDEAKTNDIVDQEMELDSTTSSVDLTPEFSTGIDDTAAVAEDKNEESDYDDLETIGSGKNFYVEDEADSNDESEDESDDDDVKLIELDTRNVNAEDANNHNDGGQDEIKRIINELENTNIPYTTGELSRLVSTLKQIKRSMIKDDCFDEIDELVEKTHSLHMYVVNELIRNGADKCNGIMRRLTRKSRRRSAKMNRSEWERYRGQIEGLDLLVDSVGKQIEEVDNDVTNFQKEVDRVREDAEDALEDFFSESHATTQIAKTKNTRKRDSSGKDWDPHRHASHKRKSSSAKARASSNKRPKNTNQSGSRSNNGSLAREDRVLSNDNEGEFYHDYDVDFDTSSDVEIEPREAGDCPRRYQSIDDDCIGETDDLDDGPAMQDTSRSWRASSLNSNHNNFTDSRTKAVAKRRAPSKKRSKERAPTYRHIGRVGRSKQIALSTQNSVSGQLREPDSRGGSGRETNFSNREPQRSGSLLSKRNNLSGNRQLNGRSSTNTVSRRERTVQNFLKPERLFYSLISRPQPNNGQTRDGILPNQLQEGQNPPILTSTNPPVNELSASITDSNSLPQGIRSCRETLAAMLNTAPNSSEEVTTMFQTLYTMLKEKCSTLLDTLNCDPHLACFQLDCLCHVFHLMEQNFHKQLPQNEILWKIFGNSTLFARHILLQIIDVLYSQLLGHGYGDAPRLTEPVFGRMRLLSRQIGRIIPILPELPNLFRNLPGQLWYSSLISEQHQSSCEKAVYVSMLDPRKYHERFYIEGEIERTVNENRRIDLYHKNIPRQEINALWSTIGFFATASPTPSKKKEKALAGFVQSLLQSKCGILHSNTKNAGIPASEKHLETCLHEMKWLCSLLSRSMLGELSFAANFVPGIVMKTILLESTSAIIPMHSTATEEQVNRVMMQIWTSSSLSNTDQTRNGPEIESLFTQSRVDDVWCLTPSTSLSQTCSYLINIYTATASKRTSRAHWNNFSREVDNLSSSLVKKTTDGKTRSQPSQSNGVGASFADLFSELEDFSESESTASPTEAFLREAACFAQLACAIAGAQSNSFIPTQNVALNKRFREKVTSLSSDTNVQEHHKYFLSGCNGDEPTSTVDINIALISSKILSLTALLHLSVNADNVEKMGLDDDISMFQCLVLPIVSNFSANIHKMQSLNMNVKETRDLYNQSKSCLHVIKSTALWLALIFDRATLVLKNDSAQCSKLSPLRAAIKKLTESSCALTIKVLIKALDALFSTAATNKHGKSLNVKFALDKAFNCCLGAIKKVIRLFHTAAGDLVPDTQISSAFSAFQDFMMLKVIPTTIGIKKSDVQELCCRHSVGLISDLAALCSTSPVPQSLYQDMFCQRKQDDDSQMIQHLRVLFSSELICLATTGFTKCEALVMQHFQDILNDTIVAMIDFQTIQALPTNNTTLLLELGGEYSLRKGTEKLESKSSSANEFGYGEDQNLWHWVDDAGKLFTKLNHADPDTKLWVNYVGHAIQSSYSHVRTTEDPQRVESAEQECEMRHKLLRSIFASMQQKHLSFGDFPGTDDGNARNITRCITKNVFFLSKTVSYYEEQLRWGCDDNDSLHSRAEIRAHEDAYIRFCVSVLATMLKEKRAWMQIVRDNITIRLEASHVDRIEKQIILKLLTRTFQEYSKWAIETNLGPQQNVLEAYCGILHTLKACLCDLIVGTDCDGIENVFSCASNVTNLIGETTSNRMLSSHTTYVHNFTKWLSEVGTLMQDAELLPEACEVITKLSKAGCDNVPVNDSKFDNLVEAFENLRRYENTIFRRTINPYAKQRVISNVGQRPSQHLKLSTSCLKTIKDFTDTFAMQTQVVQ